MKITIIEVEATAEDLKASRTVADALTMALTRITDAFLGFDETVSDDDETAEEGSET